MYLLASFVAFSMYRTARDASSGCAPTSAWKRREEKSRSRSGLTVGEAIGKRGETHIAGFGGMQHNDLTVFFAQDDVAIGARPVGGPHDRVVPVAEPGVAGEHAADHRQDLLAATQCIQFATDLRQDRQHLLVLAVLEVDERVEVADAVLVDAIDLGPRHREARRELARAIVTEGLDPTEENVRRQVALGVEGVQPRLRHRFQADRHGLALLPDGGTGP